MSEKKELKFKKADGKEIWVPKDGYLRANLDSMKEALKDDWDMIIVVDGPEGSGKSVLAQQCAWYCDPSLDLSRIVFTAEEFKEVIVKAGPGQAVIYDEAYGGLSSRQTMSRTNQAIVKMLAEIRQKNLFVFIVLPCFFDLDKYVALWRSRALIHVRTEGWSRGYFDFYNQVGKKILYTLGKKLYNYNTAKRNFFGEFRNNYVVEEKKYRDKKLEALNRHHEEREGGEGPQSARIREDRSIVISILRDSISTREICEQTGLSKSSVNECIRNGDKLRNVERKRKNLPLFHPEPLPNLKKGKESLGKLPFDQPHGRTLLRIPSTVPSLGSNRKEEE